jgi:hypothetical protein
METAGLNQMTTGHISDNFPFCLKMEIEPLSETTVGTKSRQVVLKWGYMKPHKEVLYTLSSTSREGLTNVMTPYIAQLFFPTRNK